MRHLTCAIALGVESGGDGGDASPPVQKFGEDVPQKRRNFNIFYTVKNVILKMENAIKNVKIMNGILSNYIAEMQVENYIRVGGFGPITPSPPPHTRTLKSRWVVLGVSHRPSPPPTTHSKVCGEALGYCSVYSGLTLQCKTVIWSDASPLTVPSYRLLRFALHCAPDFLRHLAAGYSISTK